jgi:iron-sulfur cluster repair protein YtfE (RIC family)
LTAPVTRLPLDPNALTAMTIRDIVDLEPRALEILAPYGFDLCCGGGHLLGTALELHKVDPAEVLPKLANLAAESGA